MKERVSTLRFNGSVWCNLDIALRNMDQVFNRVVQPLGLTIIEWYILRALYERDGQHASALARAVGRAATSFTPNLDKLQEKSLIERRLTRQTAVRYTFISRVRGQDYRDDVMQSTEEIDRQIEDMFDGEEFDIFQNVLAQLQGLEPDADQN